MKIRAAPKDRSDRLIGMVAVLCFTDSKTIRNSQQMKHYYRDGKCE